MLQLLKTIEELKEYLKNEMCYIFGAGVVANAVITWLYGKEKKIKGVIVSRRGSLMDILGFPIIELAKAEDIEKSVVIVALMEKSHHEIANILEKENAGKILYISDALYYSLECENGNYDIKEIYLLNWIKWKLQKIENQFQEEKSRYIKYRWTNKYERESTRANWSGCYERNDFAGRFQRLIHGLDEQSIETVVRIINRQKRYLLTDDREMDLYTAKEKKELKQLYDDFYELIVELSPDLYMYRGYFYTRKDFDASVFYYKHGIHKLHDLKKIEGGIIFDVGGYIGDSAIVFQELHPDKIYSFEALPEHCAEMHRNLNLNGIENVIVENVALGDEIKKISMEVCGSASNFINRGGITSSGTVEVPMKTLDDYVSEHSIQECTLIKVDIEGSELYFLKGAKQTISLFKPILLLSIYHNEHDFFELKPLIESWNLGYKFQIYKPTNGNLTNETLLISEVY